RRIAENCLRGNKKGKEVKMEGKRMRRLIAAVMSAAMVLSGGSITALAADGNAESGEAVNTGNTGGTVAGQEETVALSSETVKGRENDFNSGWKFYLGDNSSASGAGFDDS